MPELCGLPSVPAAANPSASTPADLAGDQPGELSPKRAADPPHQRYLARLIAEVSLETLPQKTDCKA